MSALNPAPAGHTPATHGVLVTASSLLVSRGSALVLGAIAWLVATRWFPVESIGESAAIVGACTFIASASLLGIDQAIVRFGSGADPTSQDELTQSAMLVAPTLAFVATVIALPLFLEPALPRGSGWTSASWILIPIAASAASATAMGEAALLTLALPGAIVATNVIVAISRLAAIGGLVVLPAPIYLAYLGSWIIGAVLFVFYARHRVGLSSGALAGGIRRLRTLAPYAVASYVATTLDVAALSLLPLLILRLTDAAGAGVFQVVWLIAMALFVLPTSVARAVFAHESRGVLSDKDRRRVSRLSIVGAILVSVLIAITARPILALVGAEYASGAGALIWFGATLGVVAYSSLRVTEIRVSGELRWLVVASLIHLVVLLCGIAIFLPELGLTAVGIAWFVSQTVFALAVSIPEPYRRRIDRLWSAFSAAR